MWPGALSKVEAVNESEQEASSPGVPSVVADVAPQPSSLVSGGSLPLAVETERYALLIEVAALVVHDLASPLSALMWATEVLKADPSKALRADFFTTLNEATVTAFELVTTLKSYLRTPDAAPDDQVTFGDAMKDAQRVLKMRLMQPLNFEVARSVEVEVSADLAPLSLAISRTDLMHVLMNIVGNAYQAAQSGKSERPLVALSMGAKDAADQRAIVLISDNGPGLSSELYAAMTTDNAAAEKKGSSMGLKLTRRLIERKGGSLSVAPSPSLGTGTTFELCLPLFVEKIS